MALIFGLIVALAVAFYIFVGPRIGINIPEWLKPGEHQSASRLVVAFLSGFIFFIAFTDRVPNIEQRLAVIVFSGLLIYANLFLDIRKEEHLKEEKENNHA